LKALVLEDLRKIGRQAQLSFIELLGGLIMDNVEWTAQNVSNRVFEDRCITVF
jgi:hypothetical protein